MAGVHVTWQGVASRVHWLSPDSRQARLGGYKAEALCCCRHQCELQLQCSERQLAEQQLTKHQLLVCAFKSGTVLRAKPPACAALPAAGCHF